MIRFLTLLLIFLSFNVSAQTRLTVEGAGRLYPIAIPQLCAESGDSESAKNVSRIIARDLDLSGYFEVLDAGAYIETPGKCRDAQNFAYSDWTVLGVDGLVRGSIVKDENGIKIRLYLYDVQMRRLELAKEYSGDYSQVSRIAHRFANEILKYFTGEYGPFGTRISFTGKVGRFKELFVMDLDGANLKQLTDDLGLAMSSSWHPNGAQLIYTTYKKRVPNLFRINISDRKSAQLTKTDYIEIGGKYNRSGEQILISKSVGNSSDVVILNSNGDEISNLTKGGYYINVSPDWSPDNQQIAFVSNRAGGPQIYVMNADGSAPRRVSYTGSNYCTSPSWSPRGDKLAFVCRSDNRHQVFVSDTSGGNPIQLTVTGTNEDPSWSPDGRYLIFATSADLGVFNIGMIRVDGANLRLLTNARTGYMDPAWGPYEQ